MKIPIYTYRCPICAKRTEAFRRIAERDDAPRCCGGVLTEQILVPTFVKVFHPYTTVAWDKEEGKPMHIRTQDEHRAFLRRNNFEEVGTDKSMAPPSPEEVAESHARQRAEESTFTWTSTDDL